MRKFSFLLLLALFGCMSNDSLENHTLVDQNVYKLRQLNYGMSEEAVFLRMKTPAREEQLFIGNDQYDIWFYLTKGTLLDQERLMHRNLTPVIFRNGLLVGMGYSLYDKLVYQASTPVLPSSSTSQSNEIKEEKEEKEPYLDEEDKRMLHQEEEEDFNNR